MKYFVEYFIPIPSHNARSCISLDLQNEIQAAHYIPTLAAEMVCGEGSKISTYMKTLLFFLKGEFSSWDVPVIHCADCWTYTQLVQQKEVVVSYGKYFDGDLATIRTFLIILKNSLFKLTISSCWQLNSVARGVEHIQLFERQ